MLDFVFSGVTTNVSDFTVTQYPPDPVEGEVVAFVVEVDNATNFEAESFAFDFDDAGSSNSLTGRGSAETARGRVVAHAWDTAGTKTVTITGRRLGGDTRAKTVDVVVRDPDALTLGKDLYVSFANNFSGVPAESGAVEHISSLAELEAISFATGTNNRIRFRRGEVFTWGTSAVSLENPDLAIIEPFGTGADPIIRAGNTGGGWSPIEVFDLAGGVCRSVCSDIRFEGLYDPLTGSAPQGNLQPFGGTGGTAGRPSGNFTSISLNRVTSIGCYRTAGYGGSITTGLEGCFINASDCLIENWSDYGISGPNLNMALSGCILRSPPLALLRDAKIGTLPQAADHTAFRLNRFPDYAGVHNCLGITTTGWFNGADIQHLGRIYSNSNTSGEDPVVSIFDNDLRGRGSIIIGMVNNAGGSDDILGPSWTVAEGNVFTGLRQTGPGIDARTTGVLVQNNVMYTPNILEQTGQVGTHSILRLTDINAVTIAAGADTRPIICRFNTQVSDRSADSGGVSVDFVAIDEDNWTGVTPTDNNNVLLAPNFNNGGSLTDYTDLSPSDDWKPVTGSAAIDGVASGDYPPFDFAGNVRSLPTNVGAHDVSVSSASTPSAPVNTVAPTIAELGNFTDEYSVTDLGTWSNNEDYMVEFEWFVGGVSFDDAIVQDLSAETGDVYCAVTMTNRSGIRTTANSNTITL